MKPIVSLLVVALIVILAAQSVFATEEFAAEVGQACDYYHLDASGGGELSAAGEVWLEKKLAAGEVETLSAASKLFRFIIGYLHLIFAVLWFGTILYVHIVLKTAYAGKGLPKGEKYVGILSFWVVGITGVILASYRIEAWQALFDTRFGILLAIKVALYLTMLISAILVIKVISPRLSRPVSQEHVPGQPFNKLTLQGCDGKQGRPAYFAFQGKVYDASDSRMWPEGEHMRRHSAGADLTDSLPLAPHNSAVMERLSVVGDYVAEAGAQADTSTRAFYFIAYMNLGIVFLILFIISLWRWG